MLATLEKNISSDVKQKLESIADAVAGLGFSFTLFTSEKDVVVHRSNGQTKFDHHELFSQINYLFDNEDEGLKAKLLHENIYTFRLDIATDVKTIAVLYGEGDNAEKAGFVCQLFDSFATGLERNIRFEKEVEKISCELSNTYEELSLLYKMSSNMKVGQANSNYLQLACDWLTDLVNVEGIAILIEKRVDTQKKLVLTAGAGLIDVNQQLIQQLHARLLDETDKGRDALLDSDVDSPFKYHWPTRIRNIIAVPLNVGSKVTGLMVAINRVDKPDFNSIDVKLFNSVAHQCAIFIENGNLFQDLKGLLVGSLKALTTSIDAKDKYTRGHSERVAFIAKWIGEKLAETEDINEELIHKIYLAGLLHDIGKIGIPENMLGKPGKLTDEEMKTVKSHPSIGASILSEIKQMQDILPGILFHHERVDGKGYPNQLTGDKIHLIGKIVSVADSFDAMTSKRTYRDAMTLEKAVEQIKDGIGTQFDPLVATAFLESDIYALWTILQDGTSPVWGHGDIVKYSTEAVGALVG